MNTIVIGNAEITDKVISIRSLRHNTVKDRLELGKQFSELRAAIDKYTRTTEDENKVSYAEAVRLTGVPRGTAELYRQMYEVCKNTQIEPDVFVLLADAGFNLARDLNTDILPSAIVHDNPKLKDEEYLLGLSQNETDALIARLRKDYGKEQAPTVSIEDLKVKVARLKQSHSETKDADYKEYLHSQISETTTTLHNKMVWAMQKFATAFAILLNKDEDWADRYIEETKTNGGLIEQRFQEAVAFAQKVTLFNTTEQTDDGNKKAAGKVKSDRQKTKKA